MKNRIYYRTAAGERGFIPCGPYEECERLLNTFLTEVSVGGTLQQGSGSGKLLRHARGEDAVDEITVTDETGAFIAAYRFVAGDEGLDREFQTSGQRSVSRSRQ